MRLHCWRGGMRSGAVQWLLELAGFRVNLLDKGYKEYRQWVLAEFGPPAPAAGAGRPTPAAAKPTVLHALAAPGRAGAGFGGPGQPLGLVVRSAGPAAAAYPGAIREQPGRRRWPPCPRPARVGGGRKPQHRQPHHPYRLFAQMHAAPLLVLDVPPRPACATWPAATAVRMPAAWPWPCCACASASEASLLKKPSAAIADGDMPRMVELVLAYYDKTYGYGLKRPAGNGQ
ncbi:MAG: hypothetical protein WKG07_33050 [Hymenobacter sp.]